MASEKKNKLFLFDVDGTLTYTRKLIKQETVDTLLELKSKENCSLGIVGGSDYEKIVEQIKYPEIFDYIFSENGTVLHRNNEKCYAESIVKFLGEDKLKKLVNYCLIYIANLDIPKKRGTFMELRNGVINICPIGRNCSAEEREEFSKYNLENDIIEKFRQSLMKEFDDFNLNFSIGGQTSIDCFPIGWDKTICLKHLENNFSEIYFFGDRTDLGGNDHEIYHDPRVKGHKVTSPEHTVSILKEILNK